MAKAVMHWLTVIFLALILGQFGRIPLGQGVVIYVHDIVLVCFLLATTWRVWRLRSMHRPILLQPLTMVILICIASLMANAYRFTGVELFQSSLYLVRFAGYGALYLALMQYSLKAEKIWLTLYLFGVGMSITGLVQYILYPDLRNLSYLGWDPHYLRLFGTLLDPNFMGIVIVLTLIIGVSLSESRFGRSILYGQVINGIALYLTFSRSSYLALITAGIVWLLFSRQWKRILLVLCVVAIVYFMPTPGGNTLRWDRYDSTVARIGNWRETYALIRQSPLLGYGFNTLRYVQSNVEVIYPEVSVSHAASGVDSSILFIIATTGVVGLLSFGWLIYTLFRIVREPIGFSILVALGIHSLFANSVFYPWVMIWMWVYIASVESTART